GFNRRGKDGQRRSQRLSSALGRLPHPNRTTAGVSLACAGRLSWCSEIGGQGSYFSGSLSPWRGRGRRLGERVAAGHRSAVGEGGTGGRLTRLSVAERGASTMGDTSPASGPTGPYLRGLVVFEGREGGPRIGGPFDRQPRHS